MLNRFVDGLVYPKTVLKYAKDNAFLAIFYLLIFVVLTGTGSMIDIIKYDGIPYGYKEEIKQNMETLDIDCAITNYTLSCASDVQEELLAFNPIVIYIDSDSELDSANYDNGYNIVLNNDRVSVLFLGTQISYFELNTISSHLETMDFTDIQNNPELFFDDFFGAIDDYLVSTKILWGTMTILIEVFINGIMLFGLVLMSSYFLRRRFKIIPFKDSFNVTVYASTAIFIVIVFFNLIEINLFIVVIMIILAFRQNNQMIAEIERRLKKPVDK